MSDETFSLSFHWLRNFFGLMCFKVESLALWRTTQGYRERGNRGKFQLYRNALALGPFLDLSIPSIITPVSVVKIIRLPLTQTFSTKKAAAEVCV